MTAESQAAPLDGRVVGVLGAGTMARAMVPHLRRNGAVLRLHNRRPDRARAIAGPDDVVCATPTAAAEGADVVLSVLADDAASRTTWLGRGGALEGMTPGSLAIECSTVSGELVDDWHVACAAARLSSVDAPMTGGRSRAEEGRLIFFAGGDDDDVDRAARVLGTMGEHVEHLGRAGNGTRYKLVHNMVAASVLVALGEGLALGDRFRLDPHRTARLLAHYGWARLVAESEAPSMLDHDYGDVTCSVATLAKDARYARDAAGDGAAMAAAAAAALSDAERRGLGPARMSAVAEILRGGQS